MSLLVAHVKHTERMMTQAVAINEGIEITFADGCKSLIPFTEISEIDNPAKLTGVEIPNPYQMNIQGSKGEMVELPWDFVRHYCDPSYRTRIEAVASEGMKSLG
jgi:hypothetical protein